MNEAAKFLLSELQKEHHRAQLAAEAAKAEQDCQLGNSENAAAKSYNGFTLFLKDRLQTMAPGSHYLLIALTLGLVVIQRPVQEL